MYREVGIPIHTVQCLYLLPTYLVCVSVTGEQPVSLCLSSTISICRSVGWSVGWSLSRTLLATNFTRSGRPWPAARCSLQQVSQTRSGACMCVGQANKGIGRRPFSNYRRVTHEFAWNCQFLSKYICMCIAAAYCHHKCHAFSMNDMNSYCFSNFIHILLYLIYI